MRAGVFYYEQLAARAQKAGYPLNCVLIHADVTRVLGYVIDGDREQLGAYLGGLANVLADAGCDRIAITAIAPHLAIEQVAARSRIPVVNALNTLAEAVRNEVLHVVLFGNRAVMMSQAYGVLLGTALLPDPEVVDAVHDLYNRIALEGLRGTQPERDRLHELAQHALRTTGAQVIILAGTDLSSFYAEAPPDFPFVDAAQMHLNAIWTHGQVDHPTEETTVEPSPVEEDPIDGWTLTQVWPPWPKG